MKTRSLLPFLVVVTLASPALADSDLCTYGWKRDVHFWLGKKKDGIAKIFCGKNAKAKAEKAVGLLSKVLKRDGYHVTSGPSVQEIELTAHPTFELVGAMRESKCPSKDLTTVYAVCVSLKEEAPNQFINGKPVAAAPVAPVQRPAVPPGHKDGAQPVR
jgi:hypothetical protein